MKLLQWLSSHWNSFMMTAATDHLPADVSTCGAMLVVPNTTCVYIMSCKSRGGSTLPLPLVGDMTHL